MKVESKVGNVSMSDGLQVHKFRVKINRQSFKLLYGDLYSNGVRALIRELSTNAADSHVKAGKSDVPFEIHLPNELEPFFYVKDFGTGLSRDQVCGEDGIYITFCDSDKATSDDFTGCLGLGSKSPLAYTDNFIVESNFNGIKYSYAVHMDAEGNPSLAELGNAPTDEPNGLKVELGVQEKDFQTFIKQTEEVLAWFKVRPNVVGFADFKFQDKEYLRKTDTYGVRKEKQEDSNVIMGNVAYPIRSSDFGWNKLDDIERAVVEHGVDLFVNIGDVEFVPSREKLRYTDKTIETVRKYLKDAIKSIREEMEKQVLAQPSIWKARKMMNDIKHSILGKVRSLGTVLYNGKEIAEYISFHKMVEKTHTGVTRADSAYPKLEVCSKKKEHYRRRDEETIYCDGQRIYLNDLQHGGYARIHRDLRENGYEKAAYMLTGVNDTFLEETGINEIAIKASTLPKPERMQREVTNSDGTKSYVKRTVLQEYQPTGGNYMTDYWTDVEVDPRLGGVYVCCAYGQIVDGELKTLPSEIKKKYKAVLALRPNFKLYGIRPGHMGRIERYKQRWMKFDDYAELVLKTDFPQVSEKISLMQQWDNLSHHDRYDRFMSEQFDDNSVFGQFIDKLREAKAVVDDEKAKAVLALNERVQNPLTLASNVTDLSELENKLEESYPLLQYLEWGWRCRHAEFTSQLADYIRGIDIQREAAALEPIKEAV